MKKKIILICLLFLHNNSYSQNLNKSSNGYVEVVEVELTKQEIYQKINEWIASNYKSAQDVIQLSKFYRYIDDKIMVKGNYTFQSGFEDDGIYGVRTTLTFSFRDNKYKIDLIPNSMFDKSNMEDLPLEGMTQFFKNMPSFKEYKNVLRKNEISRLQKFRFSENRASKRVDKQQTPEVVASLYNQQKNSFYNWNSSIMKIFKEIKDYVNKSNDDDDDDW